MREARGSHHHRLFPELGMGLGLRAPHYQEILQQSPSLTSHLSWFEATSENYMGLGSGRPLQVLEKIRKNYEVVLHGVSLNIGSVDPLNWDYLKQLKSLVDQIEPAWVSDHFCWTGVGGENLHDLLPLPYTEEVVRHLVDRIGQVQDFLGRRLVFENVSSYLTYAHSEMSEVEFISEVSKRADCGILLDVNNVYVSSFNHQFDAKKFLDGIPGERVAQIHLAGHTDQGQMLIDTHDQPVSQPVWDLYRETIRRFGPISSMIERDSRIPVLSELIAEVSQAQEICAEICEEIQQERNHA